MHLKVVNFCIWKLKCEECSRLRCVPWTKNQGRVVFFVAFKVKQNYVALNKNKHLFESVHYSIAFHLFVSLCEMWLKETVK